MATIQLSVPDAVVPRVAAALGYRGAEEDGAVGPFVKKQVAALVRQHVISHESRAAERAAYERAATEIEVT